MAVRRPTGAELSKFHAIKSVKDICEWHLRNTPGIPLAVVKDVYIP